LARLADFLSRRQSADVLVRVLKSATVAELREQRFTHFAPTVSRPCPDYRGSELAGF
jgi:hypothetical protein